MNSDTFCKKELELWDHIAGFGPRGCRDINPQLSAKIHRSRATVKRYLRNLENHHLIVKVPGWAELSGGSFRKTLRYRRIYALPWPNKSTWMRESIRKKLEKVGSKMSHYQRRLSKTKINQQLDDLLYTRPNPQPNLSVAQRSESISGAHPPNPLTDRLQGEAERSFQLVRKRLIDEHIRDGFSRLQAIRFVDIKLEKMLARQKSDLKLE